jgi:hypothetical protein
MKKMAEQSEKKDSGKAERAVIMTTTVEMLKLTADVDAASVAMPAGLLRRNKIPRKNGNAALLSARRRSKVRTTKLLLLLAVKSAMPMPKSMMPSSRAVDFAVHLDVERAVRSGNLEREIEDFALSTSPSFLPRPEASRSSR